MKLSHTTSLKRRYSIGLTVTRSAVLLFGVLLLPVILSAASLRIEGDRAWLKADGVPLSEVLQLFEKRGIEVLIDPSIKPRKISGDWKNAEIGRLIAQLASPHSYIVEWESEKGPLGDHLQISAIQIYPDGKLFDARSISSNEKVLDVVEGENGIQYIRGELLVGCRKYLYVLSLFLNPRRIVRSAIIIKPSTCPSLSASNAPLPVSTTS